jgi:hypothetical protein
MIRNSQEFEATLERIRYFQQQVERLRQVETNPQNYRLSAGGSPAELDRMSLEVREYHWLHPSEMKDQTASTVIPARMERKT